MRRQRDGASSEGQRALAAGLWTGAWVLGDTVVTPIFMANLSNELCVGNRAKYEAMRGVDLLGSSNCKPCRPRRRPPCCSLAAAGDAGACRTSQHEQVRTRQARYHRGLD